MRIARVDLRPFAIPLARPLETARGPIGERRGSIVCLVADDGTVGLGEAAPHPHASVAEAAREADGMHELAREIRHGDVSCREEIAATLERHPRWIACGFDTALWDLIARSRGVSVAEQLGAHRSRVPVNAILESGDLDGCVGEGRAAVEAGFSHAKRKIAREVETTVAEVRALGAAVPGLALRLDANGIWNEAEASDACRRLTAPNVEWIEQPLPPGDDSALAALRRAVDVRIAADESVRGADDVANLARVGACDAVVVKLVQVGGLSAGRDVARATADAGLALAVTSGIDTGVGIAAALALAGAVPGTLAACGLSTATLLEGDLVRGATPPGPMMTVPTGPGLGVDLDADAYARFGEGAS